MLHAIECAACLRICCIPYTSCCKLCVVLHALEYVAALQYNALQVLHIVARVSRRCTRYNALHAP